MANLEGKRTKKRRDGRMEQRLEIHPCGPQDTGPLGPLPRKEPKKWGKKRGEGRERRRRTSSPPKNVEGNRVSTIDGLFCSSFYYSFFHHSFFSPKIGHNRFSTIC